LISPRRWTMREEMQSNKLMFVAAALRKISIGYRHVLIGYLYLFHNTQVQVRTVW
jgi:hypothetical protein